ncbi:MAG: YdeI/OmpD-associated family protein [Eubacteriaceae bacterium]
MAEKKEIVIPVELTLVMETDADAKEFFEGLTDGYKRGYCDWVGGGKAEKTRQSRAEKALLMLQRKQKTLKT